MPSFHPILVFVPVTSGTSVCGRLSTLIPLMYVVTVALFHVNAICVQVLRGKSVTGRCIVWDSLDAPTPSENDHPHSLVSPRKNTTSRSSTQLEPVLREKIPPVVPVRYTHASIVPALSILSVNPVPTSTLSSVPSNSKHLPNLQPIASVPSFHVGLLFNCPSLLFAELSLATMPVPSFSFHTAFRFGSEHEMVERF